MTAKKDDPEYWETEEIHTPYCDMTLFKGPKRAKWIFANEDELHVALQIPKKIKNEIHHWVQEQTWPKGTNLEDPEDYHITLLYVPEGHEEHHDENWIRHTKGYDCEIYDVDEFGYDKEKAIVLRIKSPEVKEHAYDLQDMAENRNLDLSRFPGGYKPHLTIAYGPSLPQNVEAPNIKFRSGPSKISTPREASSPWTTRDPQVCPNCGGAMSEPYQSGNDWYNNCTRCGHNYKVAPNAPLLNQYKNEWVEYPDLLKGVATPSPWTALTASYTEEQIGDYACPECNGLGKIQQRTPIGETIPNAEEFGLDPQADVPMVQCENCQGSGVNPQYMGEYPLPVSPKGGEHGMHPAPPGATQYPRSSPQEVWELAAPTQEPNYPGGQRNPYYVPNYWDLGTPRQGAEHSFETLEPNVQAPNTCYLCNKSIPFKDQAQIQGPHGEIAQVHRSPCSFEMQNMGWAKLASWYEKDPQEAFPHSDLAHFLVHEDRGIKHKPAPKKSYREIYASILLDLAKRDLSSQ